MMIEIGYMGGGRPWPVADVGGTVDHVPLNVTKKSNYMNILVIYKILK